MKKKVESFKERKKNEYRNKYLKRMKSEDLETLYEGERKANITKQKSHSFSFSFSICVVYLKTKNCLLLFACLLSFYTPCMAVSMIYGIEQ